MNGMISHKTGPISLTYYNTRYSTYTITIAYYTSDIEKENQDVIRWDWNFKLFLWYSERERERAREKDDTNLIRYSPRFYMFNHY